MGCHIAEVEIDPETGMAEVVRYSFVNDFGVAVNPLLVTGQAHGGIVQGIGTDYPMPRADDVRLFKSASHPVPATTNPLGIKGCGEAGCAGPLPSVMNALVDALAEYGVRHIHMPATPERVCRAIRDTSANAQNV
jgi:carbon-monoxide dehydrogenase large subunit